MARFRHQPDIPKVKTSIAQREYFREMMAREFERQADHLETLYAGWIEKGFTPNVFQQCMDISLRVKVYNDLAQQIRRGYYSRLEAESYAKVYPDQSRPQDIHKEQ